MVAGSSEALRQQWTIVTRIDKISGNVGPFMLYPNPYLKQ
jgi:hypothetical protein